MSDQGYSCHRRGGYLPQSLRPSVLPNCLGDREKAPQLPLLRATRQQVLVPQLGHQKCNRDGLVG